MQEFIADTNEALLNINLTYVESEMGHINIILGTYGFNAEDQAKIIQALVLTDAINLTKLNNMPSSEMALKEFNDNLQQNFIRPSGAERQQIIDKFSALREQLLPLLSPFTEEMIDGASCPNKLLLGAAESTVKARLASLVKLAERGYHSEVIYPLGGARELWPLEEPATATILQQRLAEKNINDLSVETAFQKIFTRTFITRDLINDQQTPLELKKSLQIKFIEETNQARKTSIEFFTAQGITWPTEKEMMDLEATFHKQILPNTIFKPTVDTPKKLNNKGELVRPDTMDSFIQFWHDYEEEIKQTVEREGKPFSLAIISSQPYGHYQLQQAKTFFNGKPVNVSVYAEKTNLKTVNLSVIFDSLARTIYAGREYVLPHFIK